MNKFLYGAAALSLALAFTGCDDDDGNGEDECLLDAECGGYICDLSDEDDIGVCLDNCVIGEDQCAEGYECSEAGTCDTIAGGEKAYNKVLIISRTDDNKGDPDSDEGGDCRAPNPGPDIDYVRSESAGTIIEPSDVSGAHGDYCGSEKMDDGEENPWAEPGVVLENLSIGLNDDGEEEAGFCSLDKSHEKYFFMGQGQPHTVGETIAEGTGYLLVTLGETLSDGDLVEVGEVGKEPGDSGADQTCSNINRARPGDIYGLYIVSTDVMSVGPGTELVGPDFIHVADDLIGLTKTIITFD